VLTQQFAMTKQIRVVQSSSSVIQLQGSTAFGVWAWSFTNYEDAIKKFEEL